MATLRKINLAFYATILAATLAGVTIEHDMIPAADLAVEFAFYAALFATICGLVDLCIRKANQ